MLRYIHPRLATKPALGGKVSWSVKQNQKYLFLASCFNPESTISNCETRYQPKLYSTKTPPKPSSLWRDLRAYQIYGANTDVGKTVMSTILCKTLARSQPAPKIWYLKPVSTGPLGEADDRHISRFSPEAITRCLFQFDEAVSPHIAARSKPVSMPPTLYLNQC